MGDDYLRINRMMWDERVPIHVGSDFYGVEDFKKGGSRLLDFEVSEVGDVTGKRLLHLQCHFGLDTLSWARRGATVTGLDFSGPAVAAARRLAADCGIEARFETADVYDAPGVLGERYDIVYTGRGALCWLGDLGRWARVVADLVAPGGFVYLTEFHPFGDVLDDAEGATVAYDYFAGGPRVWEEPGTYADPSAVTEHNTSVEFLHGIGEIVSALAAAGLRLEFLHEFDHTTFKRFASLDGNGHKRHYRFPAGRPRVPLMYSLRATV